MPKPADPVALRHPDLPGVVITKERRAVPAYAKRKWVEHKSPAAPAAVEDKSTSDDNPSQGDPS